MVEKGIRGGICLAIHRYAKANNKYMKNHYKHKDRILCIEMPMSQKLPLNGFKWKKHFQI